MPLESHRPPDGYHHNLRSRNLRTRKVRDTAPFAARATQKDAHAHVIDIAIDAAGCARYVVTDVTRDGTLTGPNTGLLRRVCASTRAPVVASGGNGFMSVSATHAALLLAQGAGRLIRRSQDRGVVAVLDSRLRTARYGGFLTRSMPALWPTTKPDVVRAALRRLALRSDAPGEE